MFALSSHATDPGAQRAHLRCLWRITAPSCHTLRVRLFSETLRYDQVRDLLETCLADGAAHVRRVVFDCSRVRDIEPPWSAVFGLIIRYARLTDRRCELVRLRRRLAGMAALALGEQNQAAPVSWRAGSGRRVAA